MNKKNISIILIISILLNMMSFNIFAYPEYDKDVNNTWVIGDDGKPYWYEKGIRQGTYDDPGCVMGDGTCRGREIYDPESDGWYWLDAVYDGAKAENKEVWMPYIYQNEIPGSTEGKWVRYDNKGKMIKGWYIDDNNNHYYYDLITGEMLKGLHYIDVDYFYFNPITGILEPIPNELIHYWSGTDEELYQKAESLVGSTEGACEYMSGKLLGYDGSSSLNPKILSVKGAEVTDPKPGDIIAYYDGGGNYKHTATYIGNGKAFHGNYIIATGEARIASAYIFQAQKFFRPGAGDEHYVNFVNRKAKEAGGHAGWLTGFNYKETLYVPMNKFEYKHERQSNLIDESKINNFNNLPNIVINNSIDDCINNMTEFKIHDDIYVHINNNFDNSDELEHNLFIGKEYNGTRFEYGKSTTYKINVNEDWYNVPPSNLTISLYLAPKDTMPTMFLSKPLDITDEDGNYIKTYYPDDGTLLSQSTIRIGK